MNIPFRRIVWLLPLALGLHEADEWNIHQWEAGFFVNPPRVSIAATRVALLSITAAGAIFTGLACMLRDARKTALLCVSIFGLVLVGNSLQHLYWSVLSSELAPGSFTSAALCLPSVFLVMWHARHQELIDRKLILGVGCVWIIMAIGISQTGRVLPEPIHHLQGFGAQVADWIGIAN